MNVLYNIYYTIELAYAGLEIIMSEMNEYTPELFELVDEAGNKKNFELIDAAEFEGEQYFAMVPAIEDENYLDCDCELVILKAVEDNGEEILASIDDDEEFEKVSAFFMERIEEAMEDCCDDDDCCCDEEHQTNREVSNLDNITVPAVIGT